MKLIEQIRKVRRRDAALGGAGFLGAFLLALLLPSGSPVEQPIRFNHQKHLAAGAQCADCHTLYASSPWAGLPEVEICKTCHEQPLTESREEGKLQNLIKQGQPLRWKQVNQLPTNVYFSHRTHAVSREIACAVCHGPMEKATTPPSRTFVSWTMTTCMNCHKQQRATLECTGCHR